MRTSVAACAALITTVGLLVPVHPAAADPGYGAADDRLAAPAPNTAPTASTVRGATPRVPVAALPIRVDVDYDAYVVVDWPAGTCEAGASVSSADAAAHIEPQWMYAGGAHGLGPVFLSGSHYGVGRYTVDFVAVACGTEERTVVASRPLAIEPVFVAPNPAISPWNPGTPRHSWFRTIQIDVQAGTRVDVTVTVKSPAGATVARGQVRGDYPRWTWQPPRSTKPGTYTVTATVTGSGVTASRTWPVEIGRDWTARVTVVPWRPCQNITWRYLPAGAPKGVPSPVRDLKTAFAVMGKAAGHRFVQVPASKTALVTVSWADLRSLGPGVGASADFNTLKLNRFDSWPRTPGMRTGGSLGRVILFEHETGHILGLGHANGPNLIMQSWINLRSSLTGPTAAEKAALRGLNQAWLCGR